MGRRTPPITRRPERLQEHEIPRVGGRVHWLVRPRPASRRRGARDAHDTQPPSQHGGLNHAPHTTRNSLLLSESGPPTLQIQVTQESGRTPGITGEPARLRMKAMLCRESGSSRCYAARIHKPNVTRFHKARGDRVLMWVLCCWEFRLFF